jgi:glucose/mannose transport system substrate-binding protein
MKSTTLVGAISALLLASTAGYADATDVEVLHYWTSGSEAAAIGLLKKDLAAKGIGWTDAAVAGGGGEAAMTALKARVVAGNPPTAAQASPQDLKEWSGEGLLGDLSSVAQKENWTAVLPPALAQAASPAGTFAGVPFNIQRVNWMWINAKIFADNGLTPPKTWDEFFADGDKLKAKGIIPLALGGQDWQETNLFEDAILSVGGPEFFKKAIVDLDPAALNSDEMVETFDMMRKIKGYVDANSPGRAWNDATAMVVRGQAAMQMIGEFAKGEIVAANLKPSVDILCEPAPGTTGTYLWHSDFFEMFKADSDVQKAQFTLASSIMDPTFQEQFNLLKGSIPARLDAPLDKFDPCAKEGAAQLKEASANGSLLPDIEGGAAQPPTIQHAIQDTVTNHFNSNQSSRDAVAALVKAIDAAK